MSAAAILAEPIYFQVRRLDPTLARAMYPDGPAGMKWTVSYRRAGRVYRPGKLGGDFLTKDDAVRYGQDQGWTLVTNWAEAQTLAAPWRERDRARRNEANHPKPVITSEIVALASAANKAANDLRSGIELNTRTPSLPPGMADLLKAVDTLTTAIADAVA